MIITVTFKITDRVTRARCFKTRRMYINEPRDIDNLIDLAIDKFYANVNRQQYGSTYNKLYLLMSINAYGQTIAI